MGVTINHSIGGMLMKGRWSGKSLNEYLRTGGYGFEYPSLILHVIDVFFESFLQKEKRDYCNGET